MEHKDYVKDAIELLKTLISAPSISREEDKAADAMVRTLIKCGFNYKREANNVWVIDPHYDENKPTLLLNAHLDTVKPVDSWTRHPFTPEVENGDTIYGLGSNDCGGGLVSLLQVFRMLVKKEQKYNVVYLASAEEEVSGKNGIEKVLPMLPSINMAIVGEPTGMQPAIAEKGLMVLDCTAHGKSGHAARNEGVNAIYEALEDLKWFKTYKFSRNSDVLGPTLMNVTIINAGTQHNVIPDKCTFTVDIRSNENYTNKEIYDFICTQVRSEVKARSFRLGSSHISINHPLIRRTLAMHLVPFGSPTLSDQALMPFPSFKLGPGESSRSHCADEFIRISEIDKAIDLYFTLLDGAELK
jgi:acetylornithine deacetylase